MLKENGGTALSLGGSDLFARKSRMSFSVHLGRGSERMCRPFCCLVFAGKIAVWDLLPYRSLASDCCFITYRFWQICISPELPNRFLGSLPKQASDFSGRQIVFLGGHCSVHPSSKLLKLQKTGLLTPEQLEFLQENKKLSSRVILPQKRG